MDDKDNPNLVTFDKMILDGKAAWWEMHLPSGEVLFSEAKTDMLGYQAEDFTKYQNFTDLLHPDDKEKAMQAVRDHMAGKADAYEVLYRIKKVNGKYLSFFDYGKIVKKEGDKVELVGFVLQINDPDNYEEEVASFKELVADEEFGLVNLFTRVTEKTSYVF